jgi:hypothetical protein
MMLEIVSAERKLVSSVTVSVSRICPRGARLEIGTIHTVQIICITPKAVTFWSRWLHVGGKEDVIPSIVSARSTKCV